MFKIKLNITYLNMLIFWVKNVNSNIFFLYINEKLNKVTYIQTFFFEQFSLLHQKQNCSPRKQIRTLTTQNKIQNQPHHKKSFEILMPWKIQIKTRLKDSVTTNSNQVFLTRNCKKCSNWAFTFRSEFELLHGISPITISIESNRLPFLSFNGSLKSD